jgi:hypothetical protein
MSTAADKIDGPVVYFSLAAVLIAFGVGLWCNFFYGWAFTQTTTLLLCPLMALAWVLVLLVSKKWQLQGLGHDFKPQIALACGGVVLAQLVMSAVATAASARLGQVMTIVVCIGVLLAGLLSNHFLGRRAVQNDPHVGRVEKSGPVIPSRPDFLANGDEYDVEFELPPSKKLDPGMPFYYGPNTSGMLLATSAFEPFRGDLNDLQQLSDRSKPAAIVIRQVDKKKLRLLRVGADTPVSSRPPAKGDYVFLKPTRYNGPFLVAWMAIPNMQMFWLSDAVMQNQKIPASHMLLLTGYAACLIGVFLSLAVVLFQKREVG